MGELYRMIFKVYKNFFVVYSLFIDYVLFMILEIDCFFILVGLIELCRVYKLLIIFEWNILKVYKVIVIECYII